jgi:hypothetical protein
VKKFLLFILCGLFLMTSLTFKSAGTGVWTLKRNQEGISVYTRKVSGSNILEFRGKVIVDAPLDRIITLFEDDSKVPLWFYHGSQATVVERPDDLSRVYYYIAKLPWPIADRDTVFERIKSIDLSSGEITYTLKSLPDRLPRKKSIVRVIYLKSSWRFIPLLNGHTEIYFQQYSRPEGSIPPFILNHLAVDVPFYSLKNFRSLL